MANLDDFYAYKSTSSNDNNNTGGGGLGCGWVVIVIVAYMLLHFIFNGASFKAIDTLLGLGLLAFLFAKSLFR